MNEEDKSHFDWRNRDWVWVVIILIGVMILMIAWFFNSDTIELNFSIISSAVSIALASVAIFIALKQDSDNQRVNYKVDWRLEQIASDLKNVDGKVDDVVAKILTVLTVEKGDAFSAEELIDPKDQYSHEDVEQLISKYNNKIKDTLNKVVNQNKHNDNINRPIVSGDDLMKLEDEILRIYQLGQTASRKDLLKIIRELGLRSTPSQLIARLVSHGFLEQISDADRNKRYIVKGYGYG